MSKITIPITIKLDASVYNDMAESILEDQPLDYELLNTDAETITSRLAAGPEFQRLVRDHIRDRMIQDWCPDVWDYVDVGELEALVLANSNLETHWLNEAIERTEQHWEAVDYQKQLLREAEAAELASSQQVINQHLVEQLRAQGYVVYEKPARQRKRS